MSKRKAGRRGRARKRGSAATKAPQAAVEQAVVDPPRNRRERPAGRGQPPAPRPRRDPGGVGERPQAPWHPWPFSELLILVGAVATIVGFARGAAGRAVLFAGIGAVMLGTLEFTIREHLSGYRAHTGLLAAVPTALFHGLAALALFELGAPRETWVLVPVLLDIPLFWFLYRYLRTRFQDARRERVFALRQH
ncbi:MAG: hypothetical protein ACLQBB_01180 [Solirubrobacteraceae bacterium]